MAVLAGVESAVKIHIDRGDDLNARDAQGQTPLMLSASRNKAAICALLLEAGADALLLDPSGRSALAIANAAGAHDAAQTIEKAGSPDAAPIAETQNPGNQLENLSAAELATLTTGVNSQEPRQTAESEPPTEHKLDLAAAPLLDLGASDGFGFDLAAWEAEEDQPPPEGDATLTAAAFQIQSAITEHLPIDTSADWDDFEAFLPDRAAPFPRADDAESRERLRLVLLRAIREGSIPQTALNDLAQGDDGEPDDEAVALLRMVVNDLGAETDERVEYWAPHENFEVFVAPDEKPDEEDAVAEALAFVDDLAARRNDPLRIYQREFQREALLTAEAEVALGQSMERGLERALDALASWHFGIGATLEAAQKVASGAMPLRWLSSGRQAEPQEGDPTAGSKIDAEMAPSPELSAETEEAEDDSDSQFGPDSKTSSDELAAFCASAELLAGLVKAGGESLERDAIRSAIASLGLTRSFLLELADSHRDDKAHAALAFKHAIGDYRRARNKMAAANLKLVFSIAKKYLFSGQLLDDLLQEGNIGLLKAVDKFDWRRGFKFSTYATWWIRQQVGRFVADKGKTIRLPVHIYEKTQRIAHATHAFELERGRAPTVEEIAGIIDLPVRKAAALIRVSQEPLSIEALDDLDGLIAIDAKDDFMTRDPMDIVESMQWNGSVERIVSMLTPQEGKVLRMRFGIGVHDSLTLGEIGMQMNLTRERIRQIEAKAIRQLKNHAHLDRLPKELGDDFHHPKPVPVPRQYPTVTKMDDTSNTMTNDQSRSATQAFQKTEHQKDAGSVSLEKLLAHIRTLGFNVEDYIEGESRKILVHITETPDNHSRKIAGKLINFGFQFRSGKGYWR